MASPKKKKSVSADPAPAEWVKVLSPVKYSGEIQPIGTIVQIDASSAAELKALRAVEATSAAELKALRAVEATSAPQAVDPASDPAAQ